MDSAQDSDLAHFFEDWSQSEKLSEIRPPLVVPAVPGCQERGKQVFIMSSFSIHTAFILTKYKEEK